MKIDHPLIRNLVLLHISLPKSHSTLIQCLVHWYNIEDTLILEVRFLLWKIDYEAAFYYRITVDSGKCLSVENTIIKVSKALTNTS